MLICSYWHLRVPLISYQLSVVSLTIDIFVGPKKHENLKELGFVAATGCHEDCRLRLVPGLLSGCFRDQPKTRPRAVCDAGESLHQHSRPGKNTGLFLVV